MGEEQVLKQELEMWPWAVKISEKLTFITIKVLNHQDIEEGDWDLLKILHKIFHNGEYPMYETKLNIPVEKSVQQGLFTDKSSNEVTPESNGIEIVKMDNELNNENNEQEN